jgi:hypothetical protein
MDLRPAAHSAATQRLTLFMTIPGSFEPAAVI